MNEPKPKVSIPTMKKELQDILDKKKIKGKVIRSAIGPRVTRFYISLEPGVSVKKVELCAEEIAISFNVSNVRILAPIPGTKFVGVEIPNGHDEIIDFRDLWEEGGEKRMVIPLVLGKEFSGKKVVIDFAQAPQIMMAGRDVSELSMGLNAMVMSLVHHFSPENLNLVLFHPQRNVFDQYQRIPHIQMPVIHEAAQMIAELHKAAVEIDRRYEILRSARVKTLREYNELKTVASTPLSAHMPYMVLLIGEIAELQKDRSWYNAETDICRIAQLGRAAGVHLAVATQYPASTVISGVIKANLPTRIAFRVNNTNESRLILDSSGAEKLLGGGDMLVMSLDMKTVRAQCASFQESDKILDALSRMVQYLRPDDDISFKKALEIIFIERKISGAFLQSRLRLSYNGAAKIMDRLEERGIIGPKVTGSSLREILV